jgi:Transposase DDE domain
VISPVADLCVRNSALLLFVGRGVRRQSRSLLGAVDLRCQRTTRHAGYAISQQKRKLIEQVFAWMKTVGGLRKLRHRGGELVDWIVTFTAAAYNLIRLRTLLARAT